MIEKTTFIEGEWWRYSGYEVHGGYIAPARGARLERYDPWRLYADSKRVTAGQPPYISLFRLLNRYGREYELLNLPFDGIEDFSSEAKKDVAEWCSQYGPLGILPHILERVELPPVWFNVPDDYDPVGYDAEAYGPIGAEARYAVYARRNGRWATAFRDADVDADDCRPATDDEGAPVPRSRWKEPTRFVAALRTPLTLPIPAPFEGYTVTDGSAPTETAELRKYFPAVSEAAATTYQFPVPLTDEFWNGYAEPITEFFEYGNLLRRAVESLSPGGRSADAFPPQQGNSALAYFVEGITISTAIPPDGKVGLREHWLCPSLLAGFAQMAAQDLMSEARYLRCAGCGSPVLATAYQTLYCSQQCAWKDRKRRTRAKQKSAAPASGRKRRIRRKEP